ncbi:MAG: HlyD family efflux transporter periplasmic adaptor subunit [Chitinophagia bacterium]|jgi:multidrug resistance efflux pump|nr:HlyD family efflux transporter periplasmic adaptor subunit [Chitinophagia bacterium]
MKKVLDNIDEETGKKYSAYNSIYSVDIESRIKNIFWGLFFVLIFILFVPWTQNINTSGIVTTQFQEQRPQQINSIIPGKIIKWWVKEGDFVQKGDTIVELADTKDDYLDPRLIERTNDQLIAKKQKVEFYDNKITNIKGQIVAIEEGFKLKEAAIRNKIQQLERKILIDSAELAAANVDLQVGTNQYNRAGKMLNDGIISLVDYERRTQSFNKAKAGFQEKQQKFLNTKQDVLIARIDLNTLKQDVNDKLFKLKGDIANSNTEKSSVIAEVAKNENELSNYRIRGSQKWLLAPQTGQIIKAKKAGINEIVKEGEMIVEIVPNSFLYAVELFVKPMDLALINKGQDVRLQFDGYPAIVFSGWPNSSYGTFAGKISAIETNRNENGQFRVLIIPDKKEKNWPSNLKIGTGAQGFALLNDVPIWYELWRQLNGFPPDFYTIEVKGKDIKANEKK